MILIAKNSFTLQWTLTDTATPPNPINNANVVATMYQGRSGIDPDNIPGTPVPPLINVSLTYIQASAGIYQAAQPASLDPVPLADGSYPSFTLVIDASVTSTPVYHHEEPIIVQTAVEANAVDLTTVAAVRDESIISQTNTNPALNNILQDYITGFSFAVLNELGLKSLSQPFQMTEIRDGKGTSQMFTRMRPIINVVAVVVNGFSIPAAGAWPNAGWYIADDLRSIKLRNQNLPPANWGYYPYYNQPQTGFQRGQGNVTLQYWAGYNNVPSDIEIAARKMIAIFYGRKKTRDLRSESESAGGTVGTTSYRDWKVPPELDCIFRRYQRLAIIT